MSTGDKSFPRGKKNVQGADKVGQKGVLEENEGGEIDGGIKRSRKRG